MWFQRTRSHGGPAIVRRARSAVCWRTQTAACGASPAESQPAAPTCPREEEHLQHTREARGKPAAQRHQVERTIVVGHGTWGAFPESCAFCQRSCCDAQHSDRIIADHASVRPPRGGAYIHDAIRSHRIGLHVLAPPERMPRSRASAAIRTPVNLRPVAGRKGETRSRIFRGARPRGRTFRHGKRAVRLACCAR